MSPDPEIGDRWKKLADQESKALDELLPFVKGIATPAEKAAKERQDKEDAAERAKDAAERAKAKATRLRRSAASKAAHARRKAAKAAG